MKNDVVTLCDWYYSQKVGYYGSGYLAFKPMCKLHHRGSLKCHRQDCKCPDYTVRKSNA